MNKKERILMSALKLYAEKGSKKTSVEDIAKQAGIGKGTIYLYFNSKNDIFVESVFFTFLKWSRELKNDIEKLDTYEEKVKLYIRKTISILSENKEIANIFINEFPYFISLMVKKTRRARGNVFNQRVNYLRTLVEQGIKNNEFTNVNAEVFSQILVGALNSFFAKRIFLREKAQEKEIDDFISMIMKILSKEDK